MVGSRAVVGFWGFRGHGIARAGGIENQGPGFTGLELQGCEGWASFKVLGRAKGLGASPGSRDYMSLGFRGQRTSVGLEVGIGPEHFRTV